MSDLNEIAANYKSMTPVQKRNAEKDVCVLLQPLVGKIAGRYAKYASDIYGDLFSEGIIAGIEALREFNPDHGTKFSTYAYTFIRNKMYTFLQDSKFSGESKQHIARELSLYSKVKKELSEELQRNPTVEELAIRMDRKKSTILYYERASNNPMSFDTLDKQTDDNEELQFEDTLVDTNEEEWQSEINKNEFREDFDNFLSKIDPFDRRIIEMTVGYGCGKKSFDEIGKELGISKATAFRKFNSYRSELEKILIG